MTIFYRLRNEFAPIAAPNRTASFSSWDTSSGGPFTMKFASRRPRYSASITLHELFLVAATVAAASVIASMFLREVPLARQVEAVGVEAEAAA
jgi:hypothetical protein